MQVFLITASICVLRLMRVPVLAPLVLLAFCWLRLLRVPGVGGQLLADILGNPILALQAFG